MILFAFSKDNSCGSAKDGLEKEPEEQTHLDIKTRTFTDKHRIHRVGAGIGGHTVC